MPFNNSGLDSLSGAKRSRWVAVFLVLFSLCSNDGVGGLAHDPALNWRTLHSTHFRVHYHDGLGSLAHEVAAIAEDAHTRLTPYFDWIPSTPTDIVITDEVDLANGAATPLPTNRMVLLITPPDDGLFDYADWLESLITHEYTHTLHLDMASRWPSSLRSVFGRNPLLFPGLYQPMWFIEGIATYTETDSSRGLGRGQSSYFEMLMRMEAEAGIKPVRQVNQSISTWPAGDVPYLYGVYFYQFVEERYGADRVQELIERYRDNLIPFMINTNSKTVLDKNLTDLWVEFETFVNEKYRHQLQIITARGLREGQKLTHHGYRTGNTRVSASGEVYYLRDDWRSEPALMVLARDESVPRYVVDLHSNARFDLHDSAGLIVAQPERYRNANFFYDLYHVDLKTHKKRRVTEGKRYRFATWSPNGKRIAAVRHAKSIHSIDLLDTDGRVLDTLWQGNQGEIVSFIDWSPNANAIVASVRRPRSGWNIEEFQVEQRQWRALTADSAIQLQPRFNQNGESVLFSADYDGVYNIQRLDRSSGGITTLTNVKGGAFHATEASDGTLFYVGYGSRGYDVYRLSREFFATAEPSTTSGSSAEYRAVPPITEKVEVTDYAPAGGLLPSWWSPVFGVGDDLLIAGVATAGTDPLNRHNYAAVMAYELENGEIVARGDYLYDRWYPVYDFHASSDIGFHRDRSGDIARVRRSDFFRIGVTLPFLSYRSQWAIHGGLIIEDESDASVASGVSPGPDETDYLVGLAGSYDSSRSYPLSISLSNGRSASLVAEDSDIGKSTYSGEVYTLDWREFFHLAGEHVIGLRFVRGWGTETPRPFQLGGSETAAALLGIDPLGLTSPFDRRDYALRGYPDGLAVLRGRRMQLFSAEWRFPLRRLERGFMAPPLGVDQLSGALFTDSGGAWQDGTGPDKYYTGAGVELNADVRLFYHLPLRLRLGFAHGFQEVGENEVYLQLGRSF